jgi:WD40 repeat protein
MSVQGHSRASLLLLLVIGFSVWMMLCATQTAIDVFSPDDRSAGACAKPEGTSAPPQEPVVRPVTGPVFAIPFGEPLPAQALARMGHPAVWTTVYSASPDGRFFATADVLGPTYGYQLHNQKVRLWDARTGKHLRLIDGHRLHVHSAMFSPDGNYLATGSADDTLRLWDTATG